MPVFLPVRVQLPPALSLTQNVYCISVFCNFLLNLKTPVISGEEYEL